MPYLDAPYRLLPLAAVRQPAGWVKMPGALACHGRFMQAWIRH